MALTRLHSMSIAWLLALVAGLIIGGAFVFGGPHSTTYSTTEVNPDARYYRTVAVVYEGLAQYYDATGATLVAEDCRTQADYYYAVAAGEAAPPEETPAETTQP